MHFGLILDRGSVNRALHLTAINPTVRFPNRTVVFVPDCLPAVLEEELLWMENKSKNKSSESDIKPYPYPPKIITDPLLKAELKFLL